MEVCSQSLQQTHFQSPGFCGFMPSSWLKQQLSESNGFLHWELEGLLDILQAYIWCITKLEIIVSKEEKFLNSQIMQLITPTTNIFTTCILPWFLHLGEVIYGMKTRLASNISFVPSYETEWRNGSKTTFWVLMHMQMWVSVAGKKAKCSFEWHKVLLLDEILNAFKWSILLSEHFNTVQMENPTLMNVFTVQKGICLQSSSLNGQKAWTGISQKKSSRDFPGGPVAKTLCFQFRGHRFNPWSGNWIPHATTKCEHAQLEAATCCN